MSNGSFTYDLTLPLPEGVNGNNFKVKYANSVSDLNNAQEVGEQITINNDRTFTIHNLNHFTVFVVVNPNTQANCDAVALGTTSGTTCFSTIQAAVDASSNGDTITIGAGTYNETVNVTKQLIFTGQGNPVVTAFVLQTTPSTFTSITTGSITIATPAVSLTNPVFSGNRTNVTISGTGAANAAVNYTISGTSGSVSGTGTVSSSGTINIGGIDVSSLPDGNLTLSVTLSSGGYSSSAATASAAKDTQAPSLAINLSITNPIHNSNQTTIAVSGNGEAGAQANWTISNGAFSVSGTTTVSPGGTFSANTINVSSLSDGTLTLSVTLTDTVGNTNSAVTTTTTKDTTAPTLTSVAISSNNANTSYAKVGDTVSLIFFSSETIQIPVVTIAGHLVSPTNTGGNNWLASYTLTSSDTEGLISFVVNFTDSVGNASTAVTATTNSTSVTFDKTAPSINSTTVTTSNSNSSFAKVGDTVTVTLTASEAIQSPAVTIAGHSVTATNTSGNTWTATYTMVTGDTEGLVSYTINYSDLAGNAGTSVSADSTIAFDKTAPALTSQALTTSNSNSSYAKVGDTVTLNFTSSEGIQTPTVTIAGHSVSVTNVSGNNWRATYVLTSSDTEGLIAFTINFQDQAGNAGTTISTNSVITFDKTAPAAPSVSLTNPVNNTNKISVAISGTGEANAAYSWSMTDGTNTVSGTGTVSGSGVISVSGIDVSTLADGTLTLSVTLTDTAGNTGSAGTNTATKDTVTPTLTSTSVATSNTNSNFAKVGDNITVTFTSSEAIQTPVVTIAGYTVTATNTAGNNWSATYSMVAGDTEGLIAYTIAFTDTVGNVGTPVNTNSTITFDKTAPSAPVVTMSNPVNNSNKLSVTIVGTGEANAAVSFTIQDSASNTVTGVGTVNSSGNILISNIDVVSLLDGALGLFVYLTDPAGNLSTAGLNTSNKDTVNPVITVSSVTTSNSNSNFAKVGDTITLNFSTSETVNTPTVTIAGHSVTATNTSGNTWTATYVLTSSDTEGLISYTINATDLSNNSATPVVANSTITFDKTAPTAPSVSLTNPVNSSNKTNVVISGTGEANAAFTWSITDGTNTVSGTGTVDGSGVISFTGINISSLNDGTLTLSVILTDQAGNTGSAGTSIASKDTVAPTLTSTNVTTSNSNTSYANVGDTITISLTSSETIQAPVLTIAGHTVTASNASGNNWTASYTMATDDTEGLIAYTIAFTDTTGNAGTPVSANSTITFDKTNPTAPTNLTTQTPTNSIVQTWTWTPSQDALSGIQIYLVSIDGGIFTSTGNPSTINTNLSEGLHTIRLIAYDNAGNASSIVSSSVLVDTTAPTGSWSTPVANSTVSGNVTLTAATVDAASGVSAVSFSYKRNDGVDTFHNISGTTWDTNALALDNYTLRLTVTDNAGNTTIVDQTVGVATVIPTSSVSTGSVSKDGVVINWTTDDPTSSRVIYDTVSHSNLGAAPNYSYSNSTDIFDTSTKVLNHKVALTGLNPSTKYFYRVVSAGSPEAVSSEFSVTTASAPQQAQGGVSGPSIPGAPVCQDTKPGSAPALLLVKITGRNKVTLVWSKAKDPVTYYLIEYGLGHDQYQFGVPDAGNVTEYEIGGLESGVTYYFRVRAGNNCAPGEFSNELTAKAETTVVSTVSQAVVETVSRVLGVTDAQASDVEASASSAPFSSISPSPVVSVKKGGSSKNILVLIGLVILGAGVVTYYRSLQKKS